MTHSQIYHRFEQMKHPSEELFDLFDYSYLQDKFMLCSKSLK